MNALLERQKTWILEPTEVETDGQLIHKPSATPDGHPDPKWVRGCCPECGEELVSNLYYTEGKGYLLVWECWSSLEENPLCEYRRVL